MSNSGALSRAAAATTLTTWSSRIRRPMECRAREARLVMPGCRSVSRCISDIDHPSRPVVHPCSQMQERLLDTLHSRASYYCDPEPQDQYGEVGKLRL